MVVLSFNSASYDLNLIKPTLIQILLKDIQFVIKRTNSYLCLKPSNLRFLDFKNFLAPGFSNRKFLVAYGAELRKFCFSYEFVTGLDKLKSGFPEHSVFYSSLSKLNITQEEYNLVVGRKKVEAPYVRCSFSAMFWIASLLFKPFKTCSDLIYNKVWIYLKHLFQLAEWPSCK